MTKIWVIINNMKPLNYILPLVILMLVSCSDNQNYPMNKIDSSETATFNLKTLDNKSLSLSEFQGSYVLVNFWATWCKPCVREIPSLNNLYKKFKDKNFEIIAINIGQNAEVVNNFINTTSPIDFTILLDENIDLVSWKVEAIPTTFLVDDKGTIIYKVEGEKHWDSPEFISFISSFLN
jgi:thiol-disulfide isomerase/thioredoxin|tara:strand:+ start:461 stop:997 length:537 start_codon:yes stop_codon:yes gene_type:complete